MRFEELYARRQRRAITMVEAGEMLGVTERTLYIGRYSNWGHTLIPPYSSEARGRSERTFPTLQDRLPNEVVLAGLTTMAAANRYLAEPFLLAYNQRFAVSAAETGSTFIP